MVGWHSSGKATPSGVMSPSPQLPPPNDCSWKIRSLHQRSAEYTCPEVGQER
jgi:hypothetical protein